MLGFHAFGEQAIVKVFPGSGMNNRCSSRAFEDILQIGIVIPVEASDGG